MGNQKPLSQFEYLATGRRVHEVAVGSSQCRDSAVDPVKYYPYSWLETKMTKSEYVEKR